MTAIANDSTKKKYELVNNLNLHKSLIMHWSHELVFQTALATPRLLMKCYV